MKRCSFLLLALMAGCIETTAGPMATRRWGSPQVNPARQPHKTRSIPRPTGYVPLVSTSPNIDGKIGNKEWRHAHALDLAMRLDGSGPAAQPTSAMLLRDPKHLYIAIRCQEPRMDDLRAEVRTRDGEVWADDSVELFFVVDGTYYHIGLSAAGGLYDSRGRKASWDADIQSAVGREEGAWVGELAIPLDAIGASPDASPRITGNIARTRRAGNGAQESAWSPTLSGSSHVPERFGTLAFADRPKKEATVAPNKPEVREVTILPLADGGKIVRFDLSDLPEDAAILRADLLIFRSEEIDASMEEAREEIAIYPLFRQANGQATPQVESQSLSLRAPWYDRFDATDAVRAWARGRTNGGFLVKTCPLWQDESTCLDVAYRAQPQNVPSQVTELKAFHRAGQTFLTWREMEDPIGKDHISWGEFRSIRQAMEHKRQVRYVVYRSDQPITPDTISQAERIAIVRPLSCWNTNGRNIERPIDQIIENQEYLPAHHGNPFGNARPDGPIGVDCPIDRLAIASGSPENPPEPLARGTGLYVHTPGKEGNAWYAVVTCVDGVENTREIDSANSLAQPLEETVGPGKPVFQRELPRGHFWKYPGKRLQYVRWVAPPLVNVPSEYYNWSVTLPGKLDQPVPLELNFHQDQGSYWRTHYRIEPDSIVLTPHDFPRRTWWYGFHESIGTLRSLNQGTVHNYTQRRMLAFLDWAMDTWPVDRNRVLVTGMAYAGGTGALHLGMRQPEIFSLVISGHGIPDCAQTLADTQGDRNAGLLKPLETIIGRPGWALKTADGTTAWEDLDLTAWVRNQPAARELPFLALSSKHYVAWGLWPAWQEFYKVMLDQRRGVLAHFQWYGAKLILVSRHGTFRSAIPLDIARNQPVLAFRGPGTKVLEKPEGGMGLFHLSFLWDAASLVDEPGRFAVDIHWSGRGEGVGDITLRQLGAFNVAPGMEYGWSITNANGGVVQEGTITASADGLLTLPQVRIPANPHRLTVQPMSEETREVTP